MNDTDRIQAIESISIEHPYFMHALKSLQHGMMVRRSGGKPRHTLLIGEAGVGKTYLVGRLESMNPSIEVDGVVRMPVVVVQTPPIPTVKNLAEATLQALGDPFAGRGTASNMRDRALAIIRNARVEKLIFEELHHFIDHGGQSASAAVADWLKAFIDCSGLCVLLTGLPRSQRILSINEQLRRRFSSHLVLEAFQYDEPKDQKLFRSVLNEIDKALPLDEMQGLAKPELARRLYFASNGLLGYLMKLLVGAVEVMTAQSCRRLEVEHFETAFTEVIWSNGIGKLNPFSPDFSYERLDQFEQPYNVSIPIGKRTRFKAGERYAK
ncbi:TniB family NTP-binding protein [uncultured Oxalicibacterium sp.]|uniref:TniB family NTP-binding protein n=1 Tax=uncultured Oxalicibacterium sp. TaxID=1168540 RepID=UPI00260140F3|nr:TniB family NTP-binding protein [uncultured Oxalicibacterium sp.]